MQYFSDPWTDEQTLKDPKVTVGAKGQPNESALAGVYDYTERLLFEKLWQGEDRTLVPRASEEVEVKQE